jgi:hypothetical protein
MSKNEKKPVAIQKAKLCPPQEPVRMKDLYGGKPQPPSEPTRKAKPKSRN